MDGCAFSDNDGTRGGWGIHGDDGQVIPRATNHRDTNPDKTQIYKSQSVTECLGCLEC